MRVRASCLVLWLSAAPAFAAGKLPAEYLGRWALVPEKAEACSPTAAPADVTADNIQTYYEDFCKILVVKDIQEVSDPRTEIVCIAGGEAMREARIRETWRIRDLMGKRVFIEQTPGGLTFWQRCP